MAFSKFGLFLNIPDLFTDEIIDISIDAAIDQMTTLPKNEGQETIFTEYVVPAFEQLKGKGDDTNPEDVYQTIPRDYIPFIGEIVETGIRIVQVGIDIVSYKERYDYSTAIAKAFEGNSTIGL